MSAKRAALLTIAMLFTMVVVAASINANGAGKNDTVVDGYGVFSHH